MESPRFLLIKDRNDEAYEILDYLCDGADKEKLTDEEKIKLK